MIILEVSCLKKVYTTRLGGNQVQALADVSFSVEEGEYVAIMGESGSGKSTLLNILAALDRPTGGRVKLDGKDIGLIRDKEITKFRRENLGFVFQDFNLLDTDLLDKYPYEVSGGQKQRVAVARALITDPKLILADEPTGALDSRSADDLLRLFGEVNEEGQTILMVTHSARAASRAGRVLFIKDGRVFHQIYRGDSTDEQMYQKISNTLTLLATGGEI